MNKEVVMKFIAKWGVEQYAMVIVHNVISL